MKKNRTDLTFLLDRSGSMSSIKSDVVGGFDAMIKEQAEEPGECFVTLIQFDSNGFDVVYRAVPIAEVPSLMLHPRSMTPLWASQCRAITDTGDRLVKMPEADRPDKVVFVTLTDGLENASAHVEWGTPYGSNAQSIQRRLQEMVKEQESKYSWAFTYVGMNQDAEDVAQAMGFSNAKAVLTAANNSQGTTDLFKGLSKGLTRTRGMSQEAYTAQVTSASLEMFDDEERAAQADAGVDKYKGSDEKK